MRLQMRGRSCTALIMAAAAAMDLSAHGFVVMPCPNHRIALTSSRSLALGRGSSSRNAAGVTRRRNRAIVAVHGLEGIASAVPDLLLANAAKAAEEGHAEAVKLMENPVAKALLNTPSGWSLILLSALLSIGQVIHPVPPFSFSPSFTRRRFFDMMLFSWPINALPQHSAIVAMPHVLFLLHFHCFDHDLPCWGPEKYILPRGPLCSVCVSGIRRWKARTRARTPKEHAPCGRRDGR
jgi:hypothetical protein